MLTTLWQDFASKYKLSEIQLNQFQNYAKLLQEWNQKFNLTAITEISQIIDYHFDDSLIISNFINFNQIKSACDIGTGAGFPGIPLKIIFPHLNLILIEVNGKKIEFLNEVINQLSLNNIEICPLDWRTFLRNTDYDIDVFLSRASLHTDELMHLFKPSCFYKNSELVYWASSDWEISKKEESFFKKEEQYKVGNKIRKLIFFKMTN